MSDDTADPAVLHDQHAELRRQCQTLKDLATSEASWADLGEALAAAEAVLAEHFHMEERGGYMSWVLDHDPGEQGHVRRLRGEHDDLWGRVRRLRQLANAQGARQAFVAELETWADLLGRHESEENTLIDRHPHQH